MKSKIYVEGQTFNGLNLVAEALPFGTYEQCQFINCNLSNANLSDFHFVECTFEQCDLSLANLTNTALRDVVFKNSKMLGLRFEAINAMLFAVEFEACQLHLASFYQRSLKNTVFQTCNLREVDFTEADLSNARLENCDLTGAIFDQTNLEKADLRTAHHYVIDPQQNRIKQAKFSIPDVLGLLQAFDIEIEV